jgi:hypothetical protein
MKKEKVIESCYSQLRKVTPLDFDCGKICDGKCCKGDEKTGMIIFPGEEKFIDESMKIFKNKEGDTVAVCNGSCDRNKRPLACRIYPLFPLLTTSEGKDRVKVIFDYRADCPIVEEGYEINRRFEKAVRRVGKYLLLNEETKEYYKELSQLQEDYLKLLKKIL